MFHYANYAYYLDNDEPKLAVAGEPRSLAIRKSIRDN